MKRCNVVLGLLWSISVMLLSCRGCAGDGEPCSANADCADGLDCVVHPPGVCGQGGALECGCMNAVCRPSCSSVDAGCSGGTCLAATSIDHVESDNYYVKEVTVCVPQCHSDSECVYSQRCETFVCLSSGMCGTPDAGVDAGSGDAG